MTQGMDTDKRITVQATVNASVEKVWKCWTTPEDIIRWNNASEDWHTPKAENDPRTGGRFRFRMEAKDGSAGFDFEGVYEEVTENKLIVYSMSDGRRVKIIFTDKGGQTEVVETFDAEAENPLDMQREGWQAILDNFKRYTEGKD